MSFYVYRKTSKGLKFYGAMKTEEEAKQYTETCVDCWPKSTWEIFEAHNSKELESVISKG